MTFLLEMDTHLYIKTREDLWLSSLQKHLELKEKTENAAFHETQAKKLNTTQNTFIRKHSVLCKK